MVEVETFEAGSLAAGKGTVPALRLKAVRKSYGTVVAVAGVDLAVERGEFFTLLGPSGSGKTSLLRLIAGFEQPDAGSVELDGRDVTGQREEEEQLRTFVRGVPNCADPLLEEEEQVRTFAHRVPNTR